MKDPLTILAVVFGVAIIVTALTKAVTSVYFREKERFVDRLVQKQKGIGNGKGQ